MAFGQLPPGPAAPSVLQTIEWLYRPTNYLEDARMRFGPVWTSRLTGFPPLIHVSDVESVRAVFTGDPNLFRAGISNRVLEPLLGSQSLLLLDGEAHDEQRRLLMPPFSGARIEVHRASIRRMTETAIQRWPHDQPWAPHEAILELTRNVILSVMFGVDVDAPKVQSFAQLLSELLTLASTRPIMLLPMLQRRLGPLTMWSRFVALRKQVDLDIQRMVLERREQLQGSDVERHDVLSTLLTVRDSQGALLTFQQIRDQLITLVVAGHDTVAGALTWTLFHLADCPEYQAREYHSDGCALAIAKEALRLIPVLPIVSRRLETPIELGGHRLPAGVRVAPNVYLAHREPSYWSEPTKFQPQRFLGSSPTAKPNPYAYFPFGGGSRRCIGMAFALLEMEEVIGTVMRTHLIESAEGARKTIANQALVERRGVTLVPSRLRRVVLRVR